MLHNRRNQFQYQCCNNLPQHNQFHCKDDTFRCIHHLQSTDFHYHHLLPITRYKIDIAIPHDHLLPLPDYHQLNPNFFPWKISLLFQLPSFSSSQQQLCQRCHYLSAFFVSSNGFHFSCGRQGDIAFQTPHCNLCIYKCRLHPWTYLSLRNLDVRLKRGVYLL